MPAQTVLESINHLYSRVSDTAHEVVQELEGEDLSTIATELNEPRDLLDLTDEAPVIRLLNSILFQAVKERASDIHIEPYERELDVRFRIDGILYKILSPPKVVQEAIISRVKIMAGLNIAERGSPRTGVSGLSWRTGSGYPGFSHSDLLWRESGSPPSGQEEGSYYPAGHDPSDSGVKAMERLLGRKNGIILVTGPTGSGKSTTLYAALNRLNSPDKNIITIEDPIEYQFKGVGQIQVNPKIDLTFANGLRSILRQDPDIIMVGEIRDAVTAEIAIQACLTGHLVLSTLHTNDSSTAVTRLIDMGIEPFLVASSLSAILAQRLVRVICPHCREEYKADRDYPGITLPPVLYRGVGCDACFGLGTWAGPESMNCYWSIRKFVR